MIKVLEAAQMQDCDRAAIEEYRIPGVALMENAGLQVLDTVLDLAPDDGPVSTAVVCGRGNNGGDGFVVARHLHNLGHDAAAFLLGEADALDGDARANYEMAVQFGVPVHVVDTESVADLDALLASYDVIVDAILGTGVQGAAREPAASAIRAINTAGATVVAVDLPSGLDADSGRIEGEAVEADHTVALAALKPCHVLSPASELCGELSIAEISLPDEVVASVEPVLVLPEPADVAALLPERDPESHKGTYGRVLVVGGAPGTAGAAVLAARGALRGGAGLVDVACPMSVYPVVGSAAVEALVHPLPVDERGTLDVAVDDVATFADSADAVVLGPGLGQGTSTAALVRELLARTSQPVVLDADGLNALGTDLEAVRSDVGDRVLTPHPGEAARLLGTDTAAVQSDRVAAARALARASGAVVILKGHRSLVVASDVPIVVNPTGNPGMATGGTGDVLAGLLGALLAQGLDPWRAAWAAAWLHGRAGDVAADRIGEIALVAGDVVEALPGAFQDVQGAL